MPWVLQLISWVKFGGQQVGYYSRLVISEAIKFSLTIWGVILIIAGLVYTAIQDTVGAVQNIVSALSGMDFAHPATGASSAIVYLLAFCNTFTPLDELLSYGVSYLIIMGGLGLYRLVKSWIPTVGGG